MARILLVLMGCAILVGVAKATYVDPQPARSDYLACAGERFMTFGTGHEERPIAEMAAIVRWMEETQEMGEGYGNWALAQERWIQCHNVGRTGFLQCKISALPCRPAES